MRSLLAIVAIGCGSNGSPPVACGSGTTLVANACVATALTCGSGTHEDQGACVVDSGPTSYVIRANAIVADGTTPASVVVFGTHSDGTPATDELVLSTDRPGAGVYTPTIVTLDERGAAATFVPCDANTAGCTGPVTLTAALTSAPTTPVAQFLIQLSAGPAIGSAEHCMVDHDVLYFDGDPPGSDFPMPITCTDTSLQCVGNVVRSCMAAGMPSIDTQCTWGCIDRYLAQTVVPHCDRVGFLSASELTVTDAMFTGSGGTERAMVQVTPTNPLQGSWSLEFNTVQLGAPMVPGVYPDAVQVPQVGSPGIYIVGPTPLASCQSLFEGEFQVQDFSYTTSLQSMTVSFREWCPDHPSKVVSGCLHVQ
jgi:hypothetical protein